MRGTSIITIAVTQIVLVVAIVFTAGFDLRWYHISGLDRFPLSAALRSAKWFRNYGCALLLFPLLWAASAAICQDFRKNSWLPRLVLVAGYIVIAVFLLLTMRFAYVPLQSISYR